MNEEAINEDNDIKEWLGKGVEGDTRAWILLCAQRTFSEQGYRLAEMRTIARLAGVGKTTIYKYFSSKEELFLAIVEENLHHLQHLALAGLIGNSNPWECLEKSTFDVMSYIQTNKDLLRVIVQEAGEFNGRIQKQYFNTLEEGMPMGEAFLRTFQEQGYFRDQPVRQIIMMMMKLLVGTAYTWSVTEEGDLAEEGMAYLQLFKRGLLAKDDES